MSGCDGNNVVLEVLNDHVVEDPRENNEIGLRGFYFNLFDEYGEGVVREVTTRKGAELSCELDCTISFWS